jgi:hypothetical protein
LTILGEGRNVVKERRRAYKDIQAETLALADEGLFFEHVIVR